MKLTREKIRKILKESMQDIVSGEASISSSSRLLYALIRTPYAGDTIISGNSIEELRSEAEIMHPLSTIEAIFYADIIEGEL